MNSADLDEHFPHATREQRAAIEIYHDAGWTIEPMSPDSDEVEIMRPNHMDGMDRACIEPSGKVVTQ